MVVCSYDISLSLPLSQVYLHKIDVHVVKIATFFMSIAIQMIGPNNVWKIVVAAEMKMIVVKNADEILDVKMINIFVKSDALGMMIENIEMTVNEGSIEINRLVIVTMNIQRKERDPIVAAIQTTVITKSRPIVHILTVKDRREVKIEETANQTKMLIATSGVKIVQELQSLSAMNLVHLIVISPKSVRNASIALKMKENLKMV